MLLRALPAACVDAANRRGDFAGRIVIVQSTPKGVADTLNAQDGLYTLVERGIEGGQPVERTRLVGAVSRTLIASREWNEVRRVAATPEIRAIVSNVTEAGFRAPDASTWRYDEGDTAAASFPAKLIDLLYTRYRRLPAAPRLVVIPTELIADNGQALEAMVAALSERLPDGAAFRRWLGDRVRFASSLVDRITTGTPSPDTAAAMAESLGYDDELLTVTEPYALWAIEADPAELREIFPILGDARMDASVDSVVVVDRDIALYRERKVRLLNGAHTALAPIALLAGVPTVREAADDADLGPFLDRVLFEEIVPSTDLPDDVTGPFARAVIDRFRNPWLDHEWRVIATNTTAKMRLRVVPSVVGYTERYGRVPRALSLAFAAYLRFVRCVDATADGEGTGRWRGAAYPIRDTDLAAVSRHWRAAESPADELSPADAARVVSDVLGDETLWGRRLDRIPGFADAVVRNLLTLETQGAVGAVRAGSALAQPAVTA
ncbi:MAG: tagaturonate reductase [Gemmatimonadaceae bacterium]